MLHLRARQWSTDRNTDSRDVSLPALSPAGSPHGVAKRWHICMVSETYPPEINAVALTLAPLVEGLRARGHTVSVVRPRQRVADGVEGSRDPRATLVRGVPLPGSQELQFGLPVGRVLRRSWTQHRPDVVYVATEGPLGW